MTQNTCAEAASISRPYLAQIELGLKRHMRPPTYAGLRAALRIKPRDRQLLTSPEDQHGKDTDGHHEDTAHQHPGDDPG
jgi:transcriptional regulator with XRE-family HTH domain